MHPGLFQLFQSIANVAINIQPAVTFSEELNSSTVNSTTFTLKQGTAAVARSVTYSGKTANFIDSSSLIPNTIYKGPIKTGVRD